MRELTAIENMVVFEIGLKICEMIEYCFKLTPIEQHYLDEQNEPPILTQQHFSDVKRNKN